MGRRRTGIIKNSETNLSVILLCANHGRKMRAACSKSVLTIGKSTVIDYQIRIIKDRFGDKCDIITVLGYDINNIVKVLPRNVRVIDNDRYYESTSVRSAYMGLLANIKSNVFIINGDLLFNNKIFEIEVDQTSVIVDSKEQIREEKIGVTLYHNKVSAFGYGLNKKWGQVLYLHGKDIEHFKSTCLDKNFKVSIMEIMNTMINNNISIKAVEPSGLQLMEIDMPKDIERFNP